MTISGANWAADAVTAAAAEPIALSKMGSFFYGGRVVDLPEGETFHGDHGYAQYFVPSGARNLPIVMWHGRGQSGKTWESTPDGRDGFWQIFLRRRWPVCIVDQPRRGRASRACPDPGYSDAGDELAFQSESVLWGSFRLGRVNGKGEREFFEQLDFPTDAHSMDQFLRQQVPNTGREPFPSAEHRRFMGESMAHLLARLGPAILMTHSHSGQYGWASAFHSPNDIKAIVAIEAGEYAHPIDAPPLAVPTRQSLLGHFMSPQFVEPDEFDHLVEIPVLVLIGDNIAQDLVDDDFGAENWRMASARGQQMVDEINTRGGDATFQRLPDLGLTGTTHFPMADLNNVTVADFIEDWLVARGLGDDSLTYEGPRDRP